MQQILGLLEAQTDEDFRAYKTSSLWRRIQHRQTLHGLESPTAYLQFLQTEPQEAEQLSQDMLIGVTRFFRDPDAFAVLQQSVLPDLVQRAESGLRIWVPACATGEEAYSVAMLVQEYLDALQLRLPVVIFATDLNRKAIQQGAKGLFPLSIQNALSPERLNRFFIRTAEGYQVLPALREQLVFSVHNLLKDPPFSQIDLLCCRNALIYLRPPYQHGLIHLFSYALRKNAYLLLGPSESCNDDTGFVCIDSRWKVYRNQAPALTPGTWPVSLKRRQTGLPLRHVQRLLPTHLASQQLHERLTQHLIQHFVPAGFVCRENLDLLYTTGDVAFLLQLPRGQINLNLLNLLPAELRSSIHIATRKLLQTQQSIRLKALSFEVEDETRQASFLLERLLLGGPQEELLIHIQVQPEMPSLKTQPRLIELDLGQASQEKLALLEEELRLSKAHLQETIGELESANAELQAANEELQSTNEELYTINTEYQSKVEELSVANDDLNNLLQSTEIATLFLDGALKIRRFTQAIHHIMHLLPQDIGRHISHFRSKIRDEGFIEDIEAVAQGAPPCERQIQDAQGCCFMMRIHPFHSQESEKKGVVITFVDITSLVEIQQALSDSRERLDQAQHLYNLIAHNIRDMVCLVALDLRLTYLSPSAEELFPGASRQERPAFFLELVHPEDREAVATQLREQISLVQGQIFRHRLNTPDAEAPRWVETSIRIITTPDGQAQQILASMRNITRRYQAEQALRQSEAKLQAIFQSAPDAFTLVDRQFTILALNPQALHWARLQGVESLEEGLCLLEQMPPQRAEEFAQRVQPVFGGEAVQQSLSYDTPAGKVWYHVICTPVYNEAQQITGMCIGARDITQTQQAEQRLLEYARQLSEMLESIQDGFLSLDSAYRVQHCNTQARRLLGRSAEQLLQQPLAQIFPAYRDLLAGTDAQALRAAKPLKTECFLSDSYRWLNVELFHDSQGASVFFRDITEARLYRELAEFERQVLRRYAGGHEPLATILDDLMHQLEALLPGAMCSVLALRDQQLYTLSAPSLPRGYTAEVNGLPVAEGHGACGTAAFRGATVFSTHMQRDPLWQPYREIVAAFELGACWSFPVLNSRQQVLATFACYFKQPRIPQSQDYILGERTCALLTLLLESERQSAALAESNARYEMVARATNDTIWDWDFKDNTLYWSDNLLSAFGYAPDETGSRLTWWEEHIHPDDRPRVLQSIAAHIAQADVNWQEEYRFQHADGHYLTVLDRGYLLLDAEAQPHRMIGAVLDISVQKQAEAELRELTEHLQRQTQDLLTANQHMEQFTYIVSHNLRSPVANLLAICDVLAQDDEPLPADEYQAMLQGLQLGARRLDDIITDLNQILTFQKGRGHQAYEDVLLEPLLQDIFAAATQFLPAHEVQLRLSLDVPAICAIRPYLYSILDNLITNAVKYRHPDRPLILQIASGSTAEDKVRLTVSDNGLGIPAELAPQTFSMYKRFHLHLPGKGLGLYMSRVQAEALHGSLELLSSSPEGSCFALVLPADPKTH